MPKIPFVHLHCHTNYSMLDGACEIGQLMDTAVEQKMPAVAMTDHGSDTDHHNHLVMVCENREGHRNLTKPVRAGLPLVATNDAHYLRRAALATE